MATSLRQNLKKALQNNVTGAKRLAILGIGSELRADDGAGVVVAEKLSKYLAGTNRRKDVRIFSGGTAPENLTGEIKRYKPSHILIVDTADFKEKAGTVVVLDPGDVGAGVSFSTHKMPAKILVDYLQKSLDCEIAIVGIQPKNVDFGKSISKVVSGTAKEVAGAIADLLKA
jgi:hydrogenase 3 maturation protease